MDRVGQQGMAQFDAGLRTVSPNTRATLRTMDHASIATNTELITTLVRYVTRAQSGAVLIFLPGPAPCSLRVTV